MSTAQRWVHAGMAAGFLTGGLVAGSRGSWLGWLLAGSAPAMGAGLLIMRAENRQHEAQDPPTGSTSSIKAYMATGKAPISGGFVIVCTLWFVTMVVIALADGDYWTTALSCLGLVGIALVNWRGFKKHDQEYKERMERLEQHLELLSSCAELSVADQHAGQFQQSEMEIGPAFPSGAQPLDSPHFGRTHRSVVTRDKTPMTHDTYGSS